MKYIKIFETYDTQHELENLAYEILYNIFNNDVKNKTNITEFGNILLGDVNKNNYDKIKQFIETKKELTIQLCDAKYFGEFSNSQGIFFKHDNNKEYIFIKISKWILDEMNDIEISDDRKLNILKNHYSDVLLHELQHAFDYFRKKNAMVVDKQKKKDTKDIMEIGKIYYNLPHEVDAYFTEAIYKTSFYEYDLDKSWEINKNVFVLKSFDVLLKEFKRNFREYKLLSDDNKKKVLRQFGKFYETEKVAKLFRKHVGFIDTDDVFMT